MDSINHQTDWIYEVCPKSKSTDFPMYELLMQHLVDVYRRVGSDFGCMSLLVSTGLFESVVSCCCLCVVVFYNLVTFAMQEYIERRYAINFCVKLNYHRDICFLDRSSWRCHSLENYGF